MRKIYFIQIKEEEEEACYNSAGVQQFKHAIGNNFPNVQNVLCITTLSVYKHVITALWGWGEEVK